jgi:hypothetical protein
MKSDDSTPLSNRDSRDRGRRSQSATQLRTAPQDSSGYDWKLTGVTQQ